MNFRRIGGTAIECSVIGLGTGRLASISGGVSHADARRLLDAAADCGVNLIDTADSYAQGACEKTLGEALRGRRDKFIIVTKAGYSFSTLGGGLRLLKPMAKRVLKYLKRGRDIAGNVRSNVSRQNFSPVAISNALAASLERLRTDHVDIFLLHSPPAEAMADAELFEMLRRLKRDGKLREFGVSSPEPAVLESAMRIVGLTVVQTPVNPLQTGNDVVLPRLAAAKIGIMANQIFLSGKLLAKSADDTAEGVRVKTRLEALAATKKISLQQLLLQYALMQSGIATVLTGTINPAHLQQNVAHALAENVVTAGDFPPLTRVEAAHD
jgi:aryl-alcohol dehydrogenase-like predicted oxidoreductase